MELDFTQLMLLISTGVNLIALLLIYHSIPRGELNDYLRQSHEAAAKTTNKWDDTLAAIQHKGAVLLERAGLLNVTDNPDTPVKPGAGTTSGVTPPFAEDNDLGAAG